MPGVSILIFRRHCTLQLSGRPNGGDCPLKYMVTGVDFFEN